MAKSNVGALSAIPAIGVILGKDLTSLQATSSRFPHFVKHVYSERSSSEGLSANTTHNKFERISGSNRHEVFWQRPRALTRLRGS